MYQSTSNFLSKHQRNYIKGRLTNRNSRWYKSNNHLLSRDTHAKRGEKTIPGYETVFREGRTNNSAGIMMAVKDNVKTISMQM